MEWYMFGARVHNHSSQRIIVAYNHPTKENQWAFTYLSPGTSTPWTLDIDGVRAAEPTGQILLDGIFSSQGHIGWWKVRNGQTIAISDGSVRGSLVMNTYSDGGFGRLTFVSPATPKTDRDYDWPSSEILSSFPG